MCTLSPADVRVEPRYAPVVGGGSVHTYHICTLWNRVCLLPTSLLVLRQSHYPTTVALRALVVAEGKMPHSMVSEPHLQNPCSSAMVSLF